MGDIREIEQVEYHRNGVGGVPFYVVTFISEVNGIEMVGVVFPYLDDDGSEVWQYTDGKYRNPPTAVFDRVLLGRGEIRFGTNSWRAENFDKELRAAIAAAEEAS